MTTTKYTLAGRFIPLVINKERAVQVAQ